MQPGRTAEYGIDIDETGARLVLAGALLWWELHAGARSRWGAGDWERLFSTLQPREVVVVVLHTVRCWGLEDIGTWLGVSRGMAHILWKRACKKLRAHAPY